MNLVIKQNKNPRKLFSINLRNSVTNNTIAATFYEPQKERKYIKDSRSWIVVWKTRARIRVDDKVFRDNSLPGTSWLTSFLLAIESLRILVPFEEEDEWLDESGFPSWLVLPKTIDVSWGLEFHQKLASQVRNEIEKFVKNIEKRSKRDRVK